MKITQKIAVITVLMFGAFAHSEAEAAIVSATIDTTLPENWFAYVAPLNLSYGAEGSSVTTGAGNNTVVFDAKVTNLATLTVVGGVVQTYNQVGGTTYTYSSLNNVTHIAAPPAMTLFNLDIRIRDGNTAGWPDVATSTAVFEVY